ncbi:MAG: hypothetical protein LBT86_06760 [Deltaproteobacteria bacterium]|nr:hypothetical protein [Deltaproteobacteria bacterium]
MFKFRLTKTPLVDPPIDGQASSWPSPKVERGSRSEKLWPTAPPGQDRLLT